MRCDTCLNSRPIVSENGIHRACCLSDKKVMQCVLGEKNHYVRVKRRRSTDAVETH